MKGDVPSQLRWAPVENEGFELLGHSPGLHFPKKWREATYLNLTPAREASYPRLAGRVPLTWELLR